MLPPERTACVELTRIANGLRQAEEAKRWLGRKMMGRVLFASIRVHYQFAVAEQ